MFLSHGNNHSKGVAILISDKLDIEAKSVIYNPDGRYALIDAMIQDSPLLPLNIYAPNDTSEQCTFFSNILEVLVEYNFDSSSQLIIGGDCNVYLNAVLDNTVAK